MPNIIGKRPIIGVLQFFIFGALGLLLIRIDNAPAAPREIVVWLFRIVGSFLLFVSVAALVAAIRGFAKNRS